MPRRVWTGDWYTGEGTDAVELQGRTQDAVALLRALGDGHANTQDVRAQLAAYAHAGAL